MLRGCGDGKGPGVRHICQEGAQGHEGGDAHLLGELEQLDGERTPAHRRFDALDQEDVTVKGGGGGEQDAGGGPADPALAVIQDDPGAADLEVVVVLRVDGGDGLGLPYLGEVLDGGRGSFARVVPALEGGDHDRVAQFRNVRELNQQEPPIAAG
jgi:hypothetical protein